ncbi:MAG: ATP-binding protein [Acidobacteria bacterium]|nr:ATP-binding protein [Acidobacteriota bacterium]
MSPRSARGPFRPGTGAIPPYLAGRNEEQTFFRALLTDLANGIPPGTQVVMFGPRGNGKTALLGWLRREAAPAAGVAASVLRPADVPDETRLRELLLPRPWWTQLAAGRLSVAGLSWKPGGEPPPPVAEILTARARERPVLLLVDEAHTLDLPVGRTLLHAAQEVGAESPFLLVLAGTPDIESRLNAMGATFWNRAEQLRVGRLSAAATADAFRRPLRHEGIQVSGAVLGRMVEASQRYPFFVQLLGRAVWRSTGDDRVVTPAVFDAAGEEFGRARDQYSLHRLDELRKDGLANVGRAVAAAFRGRPVLTDAQLGVAVTGGLDGEPGADAAERAIETLRDLGYVWRARPRPEWEPGIPSLMDYVQRHTPGPPA